MAEEEVRKLVLPYDHTQLPALLASIKNETELRTFILEYAEAKGTSLTENQVNTLIATYITENNIGSGSSQSGTGLTPEQAQKLAMILTSGDGTKYLGDDGAYHNIPSGNTGTSIDDTATSQSTTWSSSKIHQEIENKTVSQSQINSAVNSYLTENPVSGVTSETIANAVSDYISANGITVNNLDIKQVGVNIINGTYRKIICVGDSITDGYGGTGYNGSQSTQISTNTNGYCWCNLFKQFVHDRYGTIVINKGMYGSTSHAQESNISNIMESDTDLYILLTGTNNRNHEAYFSRYEESLSRLIASLKSGNADLLVLSNIPSTKSNDEANPATTQQTAEIAEKVCYGKELFMNFYIKYNEYLSNHDINNADTFYDHVHPNDLGYYIMFTILCNEIGLPLSPHINYKQNGGYFTPESVVPCTNVSLSNSTLSFTDNLAQTITATLTPSDTTDTLSWTSSDTSVVTVLNGVVTPVGNGSATITATCGAQTATCNVTVNSSTMVSCTSITLDKNSLSFDELNASQTLVATATPSNTTDTVTWSSSNSSVATVTNGIVRSISNGTAVITATCGAQTATCNVTVNYSSPSTTKTREQVLTENPFMSEYYDNLADEKPNFVLTRTFNNTGIYYLVCWSDGDVTGDAMFGSDGNNERLFFIYNTSSTLTVRKYDQSTGTWTNDGFSVTVSPNDNETNRAGYFMINGDLGSDTARQTFINNNMVYSTIDVEGYDTNTTSATSTVFFNANVSAS